MPGNVHKTHILATVQAPMLAERDASVTDHYQPTNTMEFGAYAGSVTFMLWVYKVNGAPTDWSLNPKVQVVMPSTSEYIYTQPRWFDTEQTMGKITAPGFYKITVRDFGMSCRLALNPSFTGGTNPSLSLSLHAVTGD